MILRFTAKESGRFWSKVVKTNTCWIWTATKVGGGYGHFFFRGRLKLAHHVSFMVHKGEIPTGLCVLHKCDNRSCVRPSHLFTGTNLVNRLDCAKKQRHWPNFFTHKQIRIVRSSSEGAEAMAARLGVSHSTIYDIRSRKHYSYVK